MAVLTSTGGGFLKGVRPVVPVAPLALLKLPKLNPAKLPDEGGFIFCVGFMGGGSGKLVFLGMGNVDVDDLLLLPWRWRRM